MQVLGFDFFEGSLEGAIDRALAGGLVLAPSGPGMADDLVKSPVYANSLAAADLLLPDSGAMVLLANLMARGPKRLQRLSGLKFLKGFLADPRVHTRSTFWVMPSEEHSRRNVAWLREHGFPHLAEADCYIAPRYSDPKAIEDPALLQILESRRPAIILLNVGGGVQEPLGAHLKAALSYRPTILCTGAAIAFLTGLQTNIPPWADRFYVGWLLRILSAPSVYAPRYIRALHIVPLLLKYHTRQPPLTPS